MSLKNAPMLAAISEKYVHKDDILTDIPVGPERPLSPGIPAGPC